MKEFKKRLTRKRHNQVIDITKAARMDDNSKEKDDQQFREDLKANLLLQMAKSFEESKNI